PAAPPPRSPGPVDRPCRPSLLLFAWWLSSLLFYPGAGGDARRAGRRSAAAPQRSARIVGRNTRRSRQQVRLEQPRPFLLQELLQDLPVAQPLVDQRPQALAHL